MYFSPATIALVATLGFGVLPGQVSAVAVDQSDALVERGFFDWFGGGYKNQNLCDKPNYGASGKPWDSHSTPGAYCGTKKPSNSGQWAQIPLWDGGDTVKCKSTFSRWGLNVCGSGNKRSQLPWGCRPPHSRPRPHPKPSSIKPSVSASPSITSVPVVVSSVLAEGNVTSSVSMSPSSVQMSPSATIEPSSAASPLPSDTDPYTDPVCKSTYQVQYEDYKIIAPNGYWMGQLVGAAPQDASYMTYTLADTVDQCLKACDDIEGCVFVNSYYDFNEDEEYLPKHAPGVLTCAMFSKCVGTEKNDNFGGQDDPNQIKNSNGYCKSGACGGA